MGLSFMIHFLFFVCLRLAICDSTFRNVEITSMYTPYNITFNSTDFDWQGIGKTVNIPEYERISFAFVASSLDLITQIKYGIRIVSPSDKRLLQRPIYITKGGLNPNRVDVTMTNTTIFDIVIRGLLRLPSRFTKDQVVSIWSIRDTEVVYTGSIDG
jgi:hypothetical protein